MSIEPGHGDRRRADVDRFACCWREDRDGVCLTDCGHEFAFDGGWNEADSRFCFYCGQPISFVSCAPPRELRPRARGGSPSVPNVSLTLVDEIDASPGESVALSLVRRQREAIAQLQLAPTALDRGEVVVQVPLDQAHALRTLLSETEATLPSRSVALIDGEYRDLCDFAARPAGLVGADAVVLEHGAQSAAAICLALEGSADERIQQLRFAGALIACEIDRLLVTGLGEEDA